MFEPCKRCFYTIMANVDGLLEAMDCHIYSVRYDKMLHQVTYDVATTLIGPKNVLAV